LLKEGPNFKRVLTLIKGIRNFKNLGRIKAPGRFNFLGAFLRKVPPFWYPGI